MRWGGEPNLKEDHRRCQCPSTQPCARPRAETTARKRFRGNKEKEAKTPMVRRKIGEERKPGQDPPSHLLSLALQILQEGPEVRGEGFAEEGVKNLVLDFQEGHPGEAPKEVVAGGQAAEGQRKG